MNRREKIDFLFLVSRPPIINAGYGIKHILYLAEGVMKKRYSTALLILPQSEIEIAKIRRERKVMSFSLFFLSFLYSSVFFSRLGNYLFQVINTKINKNSYKFKVPRGVKVYYANTKCLSLAERVVCNGWYTAYYLSNKINHGACFFIVYHSYENDIPALSDIVASTYDSRYNIVVTSEVTRKKFNLDERCVMTPAIDVDKVSDKNNEIRERNSVLIPLRRGNIKGAEYAIQAIDLLLKEKKGIKVYTFGDYVPKGATNDNWVDLGTVTDEILVDLYRKVEVCVSPSVEDGVPGIAAEAMANGCAVISTDVSGARELINDGVNGMIIPAKDAAAIARAVTFLLEHREVLIKFQNNASAVLNKFSKENMVKTFLSAVDYYEHT
ncbi:MAG: glycosyltransferase family 4 protein [Nitrososphaerota archaeon]